MAHPAISKAVSLVGLVALAKHLGVTYQAVRKWESAGRLPRTEWTGETTYAEQIVQLTGGQVTLEELFERHPATSPGQADSAEVPTEPEPTSKKVA